METLKRYKIFVNTKSFNDKALMILRREEWFQTIKRF